MKRHSLPIFVPHVGCSHRCSFCDQRAISGAADAPTPDRVAALCAAALRDMGKAVTNSEIAFFGGSFTAIDPGYRAALLKATVPFVGPGRFRGIRLSTRPDAVTSEILSDLGHYGVTAVELGAQSMDDAVLARNGRGHTAADTAKAARLIQGAGFELALQMMTGLPGDTPEGGRETARHIIALRPDAVRIYPTVVLEGTELEAAFRAGDYRPQSLDEAVADCAALLMLFEEAGIPVIKLGLHAGLAGYVAGPYHPAFRQLCEGRIMRERLEGQLPPGFKGDIVVAVHPADVSNMVGQGRRNTDTLRERGVRLHIQTDADGRRLWPVVMDAK